MQERLTKRPEVLNQRRETVEHPFGSIKQWMNQGAFLMRGLPKVRGEFSLTALAYNLRRTFNIVGFNGLMGSGRRRPMLATLHTQSGMSAPRHTLGPTTWATSRGFSSSSRLSPVVT